MKRKLVILQGEKRWIAERILASIFFATIAYVSFIFFFKTPILFTSKYLESFSSYLYLVTTCLTFGIYYSYQEHHHFNLKDNKYRTFYTVGSFGIGKWRSIDVLSYTAVNHITSKDIYEVNVWDESNNRFKVSYHDDKEQAKETARVLAKDLNIDFYDKDSEK